MKLKFIQDEDFANYKKCAMFIGFPNCTFKCEVECGISCCQNSTLANMPSKEVESSTIIERYKKNIFTNALVLGGLEPFDSWEDLQNLVKEFRKQSLDDIIIYTGYTEDEIQDKLSTLKQYPKILVKFGRFRPNLSAKLDENLGVTLVSSNQYSKWIS